MLALARVQPVSRRGSPVCLSSTVWFYMGPMLVQEVLPQPAFFKLFSVADCYVDRVASHLAVLLAPSPLERELWVLFR